MCAFTGCGRPSVAHGLCNGHYLQQRRGQALIELQVGTRPGMTLTERMDLHTDKTGDCWLWTAGKSDKGYGTVGIDGKTRGAHCVAYELACGPIPKGLMIDHKCHNPACVRPEHLRLATNKQNGENRAGALSGSKSGVRGVYWNARGRNWRAQVKHEGQTFNLGSFATVDEAGEVARAKRLELFSHNDADRPVTPSTPNQQGTEHA